jgi:hypothetical protein
LGYEVKPDKFGNMGILIPDQEQGEYRVKVGLKSSASLNKEEHHSVEESVNAKEHFEMLADKKHQLCGGFTAGVQIHGQSQQSSTAEHNPSGSGPVPLMWQHTGFLICCTNRHGYMFWNR